MECTRFHCKYTATATHSSGLDLQLDGGAAYIPYKASLFLLPPPPQPTRSNSASPFFFSISLLRKARRLGSPYSGISILLSFAGFVRAIAPRLKYCLSRPANATILTPRCSLSCGRGGKDALQRRSRDAPAKRKRGSVELLLLLLLPPPPSPFFLSLSLSLSLSFKKKGVEERRLGASSLSKRIHVSPIPSGFLFCSLWKRPV